MDDDVIIYNFLLNTHIYDIKNLLLLNKQYYNLCQDVYFWKEKFKNDNLTILQNTPSGSKKWIDEYENVHLAKYYIDFVLLVNHIESTRDNNSDGIIHIKYLDTTVEELLWLDLPNGFKNSYNISNYINTQPCKIHITIAESVKNASLTDLNYITTLKLKIDNHIVLTSVKLTLEEVNKILYKSLYSDIIGLSDVYSIVKNVEIPFIGLDYDLIKEYYPKNKFVLQRLGIMDTIDYYKPYL